MNDEESTQQNRREERYRATQRATLVGAVVNLLLSVAKVVLGFVGHSQSLIADGIHSLSDLLTDAMVLVAAKHGARAADEAHPYGHARIETVATVALGVFLLMVAGGLAWDAARRMASPELLWHPGWLAMAGAMLSIVAKESLYHYTVVVARRVRSDLLRANAWHHRSDSISSVIVVVGIAGSMVGMPYLDSLAAIGVAVMIGKIGWDLAHAGVRELIDTALEPEKVDAIRHTILSVDGVRALHLLKTRRMGGEALADVHILLSDPHMSVSEGHQISEAVRARVVSDIDDVSDVLVHIDPEDDEEAAPNRCLPLRRAALERLKGRWEAIDAAHHINKVNLHYLDGRLHVEIFLPLSLARDPERAEQLAAAFERASREDRDVGSVAVYFGQAAPS
jgi:cation diffusion facilitator family transporter